MHVNVHGLRPVHSCPGIAAAAALDEGKAMSAAHWSPNLSVGVETLDVDHRALIDVLNRLDTEVGGGAGHDAIAPILDELIAETEAHFRREEEIMAREDYPDAGHHAMIHQALREEIEEFRQRFAAGMEIGPEITEFIKRWLIGHIMESDKHLGGYLQGRGAD